MAGMPGASDEQILRMLRQVEEVEDALDARLDEPNEEPSGELCPFCGEPAEYLDECVVCENAGCLPPDLWSPGMADPCLTRCVRCARHVHLACTIEDEAGNPRCPTCPF